MSLPLFSMRPPSDCTLIIAASLFAVALSLAGTNGYIGGGGDNAGYIAQAQSIVATGERRDISQADAPLATLQPPIFPYMMAAVVAVFGMNVLAMKMVISLCAGAAVAAAGWLIRTSRTTSSASSSLPEAGILALWFACSPTLQRLTHDVLSDIPFAAMALLTVALVGSFVRNAGILRAILALAALTLATLTRTAGLFIGGGIIVYLAIECLLNPTARRRCMLLTAAMTLVVLVLGLMTLHSGTAYLSQLQGSGAGLNPESAISRLERVAHYYAVMLPAEVLGFAGIGPMAAIYVMSALGAMLACIGLVVLFRRGERLVPIVGVCYLGGLLSWPYLDTRFFLPIVPLFMWMLSTGAGALLKRMSKVSPLALGGAAFALMFYPALSLMGTLLSEPNPVIPEAVQWVSAIAIAVGGAVWSSRRGTGAPENPLQRPWIALTALALALLLSRAGFEEILAQRDRGPQPDDPGYAALYDASAWLKASAQRDDIVMSSKVSLVWYWSGGLRGITIPRQNAPEAQASLDRATWAIVDSLAEDGLARKELVPLLQQNSEQWTIAWQHENTVVLHRRSAH